MPTDGVVRIWHREEGWGVIDSQDTPGGCWVHFSSVHFPGYRDLRAGQSVSLHYEAAEQDGYAFRATEVWPAGQDPHPVEGETSRGSGAHLSTLTITFDESDEPGLPDPTARTDATAHRRAQIAASPDIGPDRRHWSPEGQRSVPTA